MNSNVKRLVVLAVAALLAIGMILPYAMAGAAAAAAPASTSLASIARSPRQIDL